MDASERSAFAHGAVAMIKANPDITLHGIVVNKSRVMDHIRSDPNKLYNYAIRCCMLKHIARFDQVTLVPDPRSVKVASGNAMQDYLQMGLWFELRAKTTLQAKPRDSAESAQIQFVDMLAGLIQARYEDGDTADFQTLRAYLRMKDLYFKR